jgi:plasmid stability protein
VRTTINLDDDLLMAIRERARRQQRSIGEVLSELLRQALGARNHAGEVAETGAFYGFEPLPQRGPKVSNELIDRLRDEDQG